MLFRSRVDVEFLLFKTADGGVDDFRREFCWHCAMFFLILSILLSLLDPYYTCPAIDPRGADHPSCESVVTAGGIDFGVELSSRDG